MTDRRIFATEQESRLFLHVWIALEVLFAGWTFAITWQPDDGRAFIFFVPFALCFLPVEMQVVRVAMRRGGRFGFLSPSLRWEVTVRGPYEALRRSGLSRRRALCVQLGLGVLPLVTAAVGASI